MPIKCEVEETETDTFVVLDDVPFSNRPFGVKRFQTIHHHCSVMSLTGSCFSWESAPRPFHHGIRDQVEQSIPRTTVID